MEEAIKRAMEEMGFKSKEYSYENGYLKINYGFAFANIPLNENLIMHSMLEPYEAIIKCVNDHIKRFTDKC